MATKNFIASAPQQAPQGERAQKGDDLARLFGAIVNLAYAISEQTDTALSGNTMDLDGWLHGVQQLARQVGFLASIGQKELGESGAETNPIEWLCPDQ